MHKLEQWGPKVLRARGASLDNMPPVSHGSSIPSDPGIETTPDNFEIEGGDKAHKDNGEDETVAKTPVDKQGNQKFFMNSF